MAGMAWSATWHAKQTRLSVISTSQFSIVSAWWPLCPSGMLAARMGWPVTAGCQSTPAVQLIMYSTVQCQVSLKSSSPSSMFTVGVGWPATVCYPSRPVIHIQLISTSLFSFKMSMMIPSFLFFFQGKLNCSNWYICPPPSHTHYQWSLPHSSVQGQLEEFLFLRSAGMGWLVICWPCRVTIFRNAILCIYCVSCLENSPLVQGD